jgi:hypothetical protein
MEIGLYGNRVHCSVSSKTSSKNSIVIKISCEVQMIARNFLFNFIPKEILYVKNNSSKY